VYTIVVSFILGIVESYTLNPILQSTRHNKVLLQFERDMLWVTGPVKCIMHCWSHRCMAEKAAEKLSAQLPPPSWGELLLIDSPTAWLHGFPQLLAILSSQYLFLALALFSSHEVVGFKTYVHKFITDFVHDSKRFCLCKLIYNMVCLLLTRWVLHSLPCWVSHSQKVSVV